MWSQKIHELHGKVVFGGQTLRQVIAPTVLFGQQDIQLSPGQPKIAACMRRPQELELGTPFADQRVAATVAMGQMDSLEQLRSLRWQAFFCGFHG